MRLLAPLLFAVAATGAVAPAALANGDPPSNALITQNVYTPAIPASPASIATLKDAVARANNAGYPIKVAVVKSALDLGNVPQALDKPQQYADYLLADLHGPSQVSGDFGVLVVTPSGAGIAGRSFSTGEREAARTIDVSTTASSTQLVRAAQATVERMAAAAGDPIGGAGPEQNGGGSSGVVIGVVAGLLALTLVAVMAARARRRGATGEGREGGESPPADG